MTAHIETLSEVQNVDGVPASAVAPSPQSSPKHEDPDEVGSPPTPPKPGMTTLFGVGLIVVSSLGGLFVTGWIPHVQQEHRLQAESDRVKNALARVQTVQARQAPAITQTLLPGDVEALEETTVYARTTGYLKKWLVDIGDEVHAGQLLAEIDTPEVDQQLRQAQAQLGQLRAHLNTAKATLELAKATYERYEHLIKTESVTPQNYDERRADWQTAEAAVAAAEADVAAGEANVQRLTELQSFSRVYAPFAGTITNRSIELGQLVTTGTNTAQPLYRIAKTDPVRIFIDVPQMYAPGVTIGLETEIVVREMPHRKFRGVVTRTARAIDPATRTLLTEIRTPNPDHALLTGSYVQVQLNVNREAPPVLIPASALIVNADGTHVAVVTDDHHVHFQPVIVEGDFGAQVGISSGLSSETWIVSNPGDRLTEGEAVQVETQTPPAASDHRQKSQLAQHEKESSASSAAED